MSGRSRALVLMLGPVASGRSQPWRARGAATSTGGPRARTTAARHNFLCPPFEAALRSIGVSGKIISPDEREDPVATLSLLATQGYDLIVVDIFWSDILAQVAPRFPKAHFAIIDVALSVVRGPAQERAGGHPAHERGAPTSRAGSPARWRSAAPGRDVVGIVGGVSLSGRRRFHRRLHGRRAARLAARSRTAGSTPTTSPIRASARRSHAAR